MQASRYEEGNTECCELVILVLVKVRARPAHIPTAIIAANIFSCIVSIYPNSASGLYLRET